MIAAPVFRFNAADHSYWLGEDRIPSITQLIEMGGHVKNAIYYKDSDRERGTAIHSLCASYDLGALDLNTLTSPHRGHVKGYAYAVDQMKPTRLDGATGWEEVEIPDVHPDFKFGGTRDRLGIVWQRRTIFELKSGAREDHHGIQLALQAILAEARYGWPAKQWARLAGYTKNSGKCPVWEFDDERDFDKAFKLIKEFC